MAQVRKAIVEEGKVVNVIRVDSVTGPQELLGYPDCPAEFGPGDAYDGYTFTKVETTRPEETPEKKASKARLRRNVLLDVSDKWVLPFLERGLLVPTEVLTYRDFLRDIPEQANFPDAPTWPQRPSDDILKSYVNP